MSNRKGDYLKIFNTLSRQKEEFIPVNTDKIGIYVCGPTTYNFIHVGNARPYVIFDVLRRFLEYCGHVVNYVQNFTDIDDKIIQKANTDRVNFIDISNRYIAEFFIDADALNVQRASHYPRVTEEIDEIIALVQLLVDRDFAYEVDGTIYFRSNLANKYGKLSKKNIEDLESGARVETNPVKESPSDFVLWKAAKTDEPSWDSPWGHGRPGWHIECSVMARKYIGNTVDIHAGGDDLMFPHHENEIAQSEAAFNAPFVNYWMHNGMLLVNNQKMAKSEGNFFLVREVAGKYGYDVLRFFLLLAHYRSPLNFSEKLMKAAANGWERITNCQRDLPAVGTLGDAGFTPLFVAALADDLNTANAIATIFDLVKEANIALREGRPLDGYLAELNFMLSILGLDFKASKNTKKTEIENLIAQRDVAKAAKDWMRADEIRDQLAAMGVTVKDTREGTKWHLTK